MELLKRLGIVLRRRWPIVLVFLAIAAVGVSVYEGTARRQYTASMELFLRAPDVKTSAGAYQGDLFSRQRAQTYANMFKSDELAQLVIDKLGLKVTPNQLAAQVSAKTVKDTVLMVVSATDPDPQRAANIANGYGAVLNGFVAKLENVATNPDIPPLVQIVGNANAASARPTGYPLWLVAGAGFGAAALLSVVGVWFVERFDTKLRSRRQIVDIAGADVIGKFPKTSALGGDGDVAAAFKESEPFAQAALRASINIESLLDRLPAQSGPAVVSLVAVHDGDGTTTLARSLVRAFGDRGRKVCLVALDSTSAETALVTVGTGDSAPSVVATTATLTVGGVRRALDAMRGEGDIVLVDSVAFESSVDAQLTVAAADAALVVVSPLTTTTAALTELTAGIEVLEKPVLGVIINGVTESNTVDGYYL